MLTEGVDSFLYRLTTADRASAIFDLKQIGSVQQFPWWSLFTVPSDSALALHR
jgi:hypothetical protein